MFRNTNKFIYLFFAGILFLLNSCTKDSGSVDAAISGTGTAGSLSRFTIVGNYLYAVDETQLNIFNISDPANTFKVGTQTIGFGIETIFPYKDKLFIGSTGAMFIYSLASPAAPQLLGGVAHFRACDPVVANDTVAYVTLHAGTRCGGVFNDLIVYDIRNINQPVEKLRIGLTSPKGLGYSGNALYVCDQQQLRVYDITNNLTPLAGTSFTTTENFYDLIPYGNTLICYIDKGVSFYNITDRLHPVFLSKLTN